MRGPVLSCRRPGALVITLALFLAVEGAVIIVPRAGAIGPVPAPSASPTPPSSDASPAPASPAPSPAAPASARPKPHPCSADVKSELTTVIDAQLAAFRADDYAKAFTFAAGPIKTMFTQPEFEAMVRKAYPVIAHSTSVDYGMAFDTGEEAVIYVRVQNTDTKGDAQYQYLLKKEDGAWKIGGVSEVKPEGLSV